MLINGSDGGEDDREGNDHAHVERQIDDGESHAAGDRHNIMAQTAEHMLMLRMEVEREVPLMKAAFGSPPGEGERDQRSLPGGRCHQNLKQNDA